MLSLEKAFFSGIPFGSILYGARGKLSPTHPLSVANGAHFVIPGFVIVLFVQCMARCLTLPIADGRVSSGVRVLHHDQPQYLLRFVAFDTLRGSWTPVGHTITDA